MIKKPLKDFTPMMDRCSNCSYCKWVPLDQAKSQEFGACCPANEYYHFNAYSARGRFQLGLALVKDQTAYTEKTAEIVHSCLSCGACDVSCKVCRYNLEPLENNMALKQDAVEKGCTLPAQQAMLHSLKQEKTLIPEAKKSERTLWAKGLSLTDVLKHPGEADVLFFPGCKYSYDPKTHPLLRSMVAILQKAGVNVGYLGEADCCCGARAWQMGFADAFTAQAKANGALFSAAAIHTIVTPCADCYHGFKRLYAELGVHVEVLHYTEYLDRLLQAGALRLTHPVPMTVTYHDPCHLGRQGEPYEPWEGKEQKIFNQVVTWSPDRPRYNGAKGIYDAPRRVLKAIPGLQLVEMERIREYSYCCGAGGGCSETLPEFSEKTASDRVREAKATGASCIATACPWCRSNLSEGGAMEVRDITELVLLAMEGGACDEK